MDWHWFSTPEGAAALVDRSRCQFESSRSPDCKHCQRAKVQRLDIIRSAVEIERAAVLAWLRDQAVQARATYDTRADMEIGLTALRVSQTCARTADAIERGDHHP